MRAVVQRVRAAQVVVVGETVGRIGRGLLVLLGAGPGDDDEDADYLVGKVLGLRIFPDAEGQMNLDLSQVQGQLLVVSQFTLFGDCRRGRRPSFSAALEPVRAEQLVTRFIERARGAGVEVASGRFGALMDVSLLNEGPVTLLLDSKRAF